MSIMQYRVGVPSTECTVLFLSTIMINVIVNALCVRHVLVFTVCTH